MQLYTILNCVHCRDHMQCARQKHTSQIQHKQTSQT
jgi:hypothetical protein